MKKIFYLIVAGIVAFLQGGCYQDKGNYDYSNIGDVTVTLTNDIHEYRAVMSQHLVIPVTVTTAANVPESELTYTWERIHNNSYFKEIGQGKDFDFRLGPDDAFPTYGTYTVRLKVSRQVGSYTHEVYSDLVNIIISGDVGLMVLHGDASGCDIGVIQDADFLMRAGAQVTPQTIYNGYSSANGSKIPGTGKSIIQQHPSSANVETCNVYVITDQTMVYAYAAGLAKKGNYGDLFYGAEGQAPLYKGNPKQFAFYNSQKSVIDDGDIFCASGSANPRFSLRTTFTGFPNYKASPYSYLNYSAVIFDMNSRSFFRTGLQSVGNQTPTVFNSTKGAFNLADMKADLLYFDLGGNKGNYMGIFRSDDGVVFLGEINLAAKDDGPGNTFAYAKYDISRLPQFESARFHAFGVSNSMCYYATASDVYYYAALRESGTSTAKKLVIGTDEIKFPGEITMMKLLKVTINFSDYQYFGKMMIVGTYENGQGTLHAILLDNMTGTALSHRTFTGFDRIYDANLKSF